MLINFEFEEVNGAVIRNAQIWRHKEFYQDKEEIVVLVPEILAGLYFHADKIVTFTPKNIKKYSEVLEFNPTNWEHKFYHLLESLHAFFYKINFTRSISYRFFRKTPRQDHFYINSGLEKKLLSICTEKFGEFKYFRMSDYYDLSLMVPVKPDPTSWFITSFEYIQEMISAGSVAKVQKHNNNLARPRICLRTRNFKNKAVIHNSKKSILAPLVLELLKYNCEVINIGTPHLPLGIIHANYSEQAHNLSISDEFNLCGESSCTIMTTEAGNFMAFSATDVRIVQYDDEIFERIWKSPLSLFKARKKAFAVFSTNRFVRQPVSKIL